MVEVRREKVSGFRCQSLRQGGEERFELPPASTNSNDSITLQKLDPFSFASRTLLKPTDRFVNSPAEKYGHPPHILIDMCEFICTYMRLRNLQEIDITFESVWTRELCVPSRDGNESQSNVTGISIQRFRT